MCSFKAPNLGKGSFSFCIFIFIITSPECVELRLHSPNTSSWCGAQLKHRDNFTFKPNVLVTAKWVHSYFIEENCKNWIFGKDTTVWDPFWFIQLNFWEIMACKSMDSSLSYPFRFLERSCTQPYGLHHFSFIQSSDVKESRKWMIFHAPFWFDFLSCFQRKTTRLYATSQVGHFIGRVMPSLSLNTWTPDSVHTLYMHMLPLILKSLLQNLSIVGLI